MSLRPPQTEERRAELERNNRRLLHCLDCGGRVVVEDRADD